MKSGYLADVEPRKKLPLPAEVQWYLGSFLLYLPQSPRPVAAGTFIGPSLPGLDLLVHISSPQLLLVATQKAEIYLVVTEMKSDVLTGLNAPCIGSLAERSIKFPVY